MAKAKSQKSTRSGKSKKLDAPTATVIGAILTLVGTVITAIVAPIYRERILNTPVPTAAQLTNFFSAPSPTITLFVPSSTSSPTDIPLASTPAQVLPTSTFLPRASIESFEVLNTDRTIIASLKPGEITNVEAGSNVIIKVNVSSLIPLEELFFTWRTCSQPERVIEGLRVTEISHQVSSTRGTDCIRVTIKKEGFIITNLKQISLNVN